MRFGLSNWSLRNRLILSTLLLAAIAIAASDFVASNSLRTFLINQADSQLNEVVQTSMLRLDRAGIDTANLEEDSNEYGFRPLRPLEAVPTTTAVTLLDVSGNVVGQIGGEFANPINLNEFSKLTPKKVDSLKGLPFTIPGDRGEPDIRAIARPLPSGEGTVVISVALDSVDKTVAGLTGIFLLISFIVLAAVVYFGVKKIGLDRLDKAKN
jgi:two-component system OmpR family sensor kinase